MFTKSVGFAARRSVRDFVQRNISKTSSVPNSDAMTSRSQIQNIQNENAEPSKWVRLSKHNNNRALSTLQTKILPQKDSKMSLVAKEESRQLMAMFPDIVRDLTNDGKYTDIPEVTKRFTKVLQYNVPTGKKNRALALIAAYKMLEDPAKLTPENMKLAMVLGWCVEMLQAYFLVNDDMMDNSDTRRGQPCWYKNGDVGLAAINDAILIENGIYSILKKYFSNHQSYLKIIELFHDISLKTSLGQALDIFSKKDGRPNLDAFTMNRYNAIVKYKTAYYTFQLPVTLAMYLAGNYQEELHRQAKTILLEMGHFFQVQDDFLDCFGDPAITGKVGTDIQEGKCSWLVIVALQRATPEQRRILDANYGNSDSESVAAVKKLYEELGLPNTYSIYEEESYNLIRTHIQQISKGLPHNLFFKFMEKLYKRES